MPLKKGKLIAEADITDWYENTLRSEVEIKDDADLFKLVDGGMPTGELVRHSIVNQEVSGKHDLLGANKLLLYTGGRAALAEKISRQRETVQINGCAYQMPKYVGPVMEKPNGNGNGEAGTATLALEMPNANATEVKPDEPAMPTAYAARLSEDGARAARAYLQHAVPGHILPRLVMLREHGLDVRGAADALKAEIDAMVSRLM